MLLSRTEKKLMHLAFPQVASVRKGFETELLKVPEGWAPNYALPEEGFTETVLMSKVKVESVSETVSHFHL